MQFKKLQQALPHGHIFRKLVALRSDGASVMAGKKVRCYSSLTR